MKYSAVMVIRNKFLNETVASSYRDSNNLSDIQDWINRAKQDYEKSGCMATITVSEYIAPNQNYKKISTIEINGV